MGSQSRVRWMMAVALTGAVLVTAACGSPSSTGAGSSASDPSSGASADRPSLGDSSPDEPTQASSTQIPSQAELSGIQGVVLVDGTPASGYLIVPTSLAEPSVAIPEMALLSDERGRFEWPLPPGTYRLTATRADAPAIAPIDVEVPATGSITVELHSR